MATPPAQGHDLSVVLAVLDAAGVAIALLEPDGVVLTTNDSFARVCGRPSGELVGGTLADSIIADDRERYREVVSAVSVADGTGEDTTTETRFVGADGRVRPVRLDLALLDGALATDAQRRRVVLCVASDRASERRRERADRRARVRERTGEMTDPATGMLNQRGIDLTLESASRRASRNASAYALIRCTVAVEGAAGDQADGQAGADAPDQATFEEALMACVDRVRQRLRPSDTVARIDDALLVVAEDLGDEQDAAGVTYRILSTVVEPVPTSDGPLTLSMVAGIAVADGSTPVHKIVAESIDRAARATGVGGFELGDLRRSSE